MTSVAKYRSLPSVPAHPLFPCAQGDSSITVVLASAKFPDVLPISFLLKPTWCERTFSVCRISTQPVPKQQNNLDFETTG
jgi:hypothetical protein